MVDRALSWREHIGAGLLCRVTLLLPLCGCFVDPGRYSSQSDTGSTSTGDPDTDGTTAPVTPTSSDTTAVPESDTTTTTGDDDTTTTTTTTTDLTTDPATTAPVTTGPPPSLCGNGVIEVGEACDNGPLNGGEDCTANCAAPSCTDLTRNQGESDVDCGGPCKPCDVCQACDFDSDCSGGACIAGICTVTVPVVVNYVLDCAGDSSLWPVLGYLPQGSYRVTADGGGGSNTADPTYGWIAQCDGFDLSEMSAGFGYATPEEAYAALPVKEVLRTFPGDNLRCGLIDVVCGDNQGSIGFTFTSTCK